MGTLDEVTTLRSQGISDNEIIGSLRGRGVSPKEISDAMGQDQIKNAVGSIDSGMESSIMDSSVPGVDQAPSSPDPAYAGGAVDASAQAYDAPNTPQAYDVPATPQAYDAPPAVDYGAPAAPMAGQAYDNVADPQMGADYGGGYADDGYGGGTDTIIEVSEQVFAEKSKGIKKQVSENNEFRVLATSKIDDISARLKRIEGSIDKLQSAILEKVGEYGSGLQSIKKEMDMMQDSFKKVVAEK